MTPRWVYASRLGVYASFALFTAALALAFSGNYGAHAWLALTGGLTLFPVSVWVAYAASAGREEASRPGYLAASAASIALTLAGGLAGLRYPSLGSGMLGLGLLSASAAGFKVVGGVRRGEARLSVALGSLAALAGGAYALSYPVVLGSPSGIPVWLALGLTASFPVPLIVAVTIHSLPSTFRDSPSRPGAYAAMALTLATPAAFLYSPRAGSALLGLQLLTYAYAARLYRVSSYAATAREYKAPAARAGAVFYAYSHALALAFALASAAAAWAYAAGILGGLELLHVVAAGFTAIHVYIHTPMMLPTILTLPAARRFRLALASVALSAASGAAWPASRLAALAAAAGALALAVVAGFRLTPGRGGGARGGSRAAQPSS